METVENNKVKENSAEILTEATLQTIKEIHEYVNFNEYQYKNNLNPSFIDDEEIKTMIMKLSLNQRKKLKRVINRFRMKGSLRSVNLFYHFLMAKVLKTDTRISVIYGDKQLAIIAKRKKYIEVKNLMDKMREEYVDEKGDFYKVRITKDQKLQ